MLGRSGLIAFLLALMMLGSGVAVARPRDEVLAGAFRCGAVADSRMWLDCYYGAAQPVRAALRLAPVPSGQAQLASAPPAGGVPQNTAVRDVAMSEASRCYGYSEDRAWLSCYYAAVQPLRALLGLPATPNAVTRPGAPGTVSEPSGNWFLGSGRAESARMTDYRIDAQGHFTATLDNGQVWRQMPGDVKKARWKARAGDYRVTIQRGALGSTNLAVDGQPGLYRVEQLR